MPSFEGCVLFRTGTPYARVGPLEQPGEYDETGLLGKKRLHFICLLDFQNLGF